MTDDRKRLECTNPKGLGMEWHIESPFRWIEGHHGVRLTSDDLAAHHQRQLAVDGAVRLPGWDDMGPAYTLKRCQALDFLRVLRVANIVNTSRFEWHNTKPIGTVCHEKIEVSTLSGRWRIWLGGCFLFGNGSDAAAEWCYPTRKHVHHVGC